jgi:hypothetical protein
MADPRDTSDTRDNKERVIEAVRKLVKAKGRYHTEQNYAALRDALASYDEATRCQPHAIGAVPELPARWGAVETVGDLVRNLLTIDQAEPIYTAFHVDFDGVRRCRTRPVMISRERVIDAKWVDPTRKDVRYAHVIWAKPDESASTQPPEGDHHA